MHAAHRRKGFTIIELVLASAIGGVVIIACMAAMAALERSDRTLAVRAQQTNELEIAHKAVRGALLGLVMAPRSSERPQTGIAVEPEGLRPQANRPARFQLREADRAFGPRVMGESRVLKPGDRVKTQRLELVLRRPPLKGIRSVARDAPVRGAFELRPTRPDELARRSREGEPLGMSLWWVSGSTSDQLLASGLSACQWMVFADRERVREFSAASWSDLPAYVEMEVETLGGAYANWLFEVDAIASERAVGGSIIDAPEETDEADSDSDDPPPATSDDEEDEEAEG